MIKESLLNKSRLNTAKTLGFLSGKRGISIASLELPESNPNKKLNGCRRGKNALFPSTFALVIARKGSSDVISSLWQK